MSRTLRPRHTQAPRGVVGCWAVFVLLGVPLLAATAHRAETTGLQPATLDHHLARVAGPDARDLRVNGVYGSGHDGAWQFVAHLTWRTPAGHVAGGVTTLPQRAGAPAIASSFDEARLQEEERVGWTLPDLRRAIAGIDGADAPLAMLSLETTTTMTTQSGQFAMCHASTPSRARCTARTPSGQSRTFADALTDQPGLDALAVQRRSARVEPAQ